MRGGDSVTEEKARDSDCGTIIVGGGLFLKIFGVVCRNRTSTDV